MRHETIVLAGLASFSPCHGLSLWDVKVHLWDNSQEIQYVDI
jgi:hypothetical protein